VAATQSARIRAPAAALGKSGSYALAAEASTQSVTAGVATSTRHRNLKASTYVSPYSQHKRASQQVP
jgi:hypothetical protein